MVQDYSSGVSNKSVYLTQTTDIFFASLSEQSPKILFTHRGNWYILFLFTLVVIYSKTEHLVQCNFVQA